MTEFESGEVGPVASSESFGAVVAESAGSQVKLLKFGPPALDQKPHPDVTHPAVPLQTQTLQLFPAVLLQPLQHCGVDVGGGQVEPLESGGNGDQQLSAVDEGEGVVAEVQGFELLPGALGQVLDCQP